MAVLWFNGRWTTTDEPVVKVEDRGLQFGDSIYEVLKFRRRAPLLVERHYARLARCLSLLEIASPWDEASFARLLGDLIARTEFDRGLIYMQVTRGVARRQHVWRGNAEPTALAYTIDFEFPSETAWREGISVIRFAENRWRRCDLKTTNLLANAMAKNAAARAGAAEVIFVDGDEAIECSSSSLFAVVDGRLVTHADDARVLPGTVRDAVIELAAERGIRVERRAIRLPELRRADEIFVTSTSQGVMPVVSIDGSDARVRGPVTARLQELCAALEDEEIERWHSTRNA